MRRRWGKIKIVEKEEFKDEEEEKILKLWRRE